ncbi:MAG TPA: TonB-dependent receptor plug domain-containing protein, partial [Gammaproteobacteria bacterium]
MSIRSRLPRPAACLVAAFAAPLLHAQNVLEEVRVVGAPHDRSPNDVAQPIGVVAGETLRRSLRNTLGETLAGELGVSSTYFGPGASRPVIRGLAGPRVKVLEDGIDALDAASVSVDHAVGVDPLAAQQVEIFRGPTTLLYGSGAVGGVVNTVTNRIPFAAEDGLDARVELRGDTASRARSAAVRLDGAADALAWHFDGSRRIADDYEVPDDARLGHHDGDEPAAGIVPNSDFATGSAAAGAAWIGARASFGVAVSRLESGYGVPGHVHAKDAHDDAGPHPDVDGAPADARIDLAHTRLDVRADHVGLRRFPEIALALGGSDYEHVELEGTEPATHVGSDAYEGRVEVLHAPWGTWQGAFGAQLGGREIATIGDDAFMPPTDTRTAGVFVLEHRDFAAWQLSLGA